jgi:hypothetical protein
VTLLPELLYYSLKKEDYTSINPNKSSWLPIVTNTLKGIGKFSLTIDNLNPNTDYYFNSFTFNSSGGEVYGNQLNFKTKSLVSNTTINKI